MIHSTDEVALERWGVELSLTVGKLAEQMQRQNYYMERMLAQRAETPRFIRIHGSVTVDASGNGLCTFDNAGPDQGWYWSLRRLYVARAGSASAVAGTASVYVTASNNNPSQLDLVDFAPNIPLFGDYSDNEVVLRFNEELLVQFSGCVASTVQIATGFIVQYQEAASGQRFMQ